MQRLARVKSLADTLAKFKVTDSGSIAAAMAIISHAPPRKQCLEFRQTPRYDAARRPLAALSHKLAQAGKHWDYADAIAHRLSRGKCRRVEHLPARQVVMICRLISNRGSN